MRCAVTEQGEAFMIACRRPYDVGCGGPELVPVAGELLDAAVRFR